MIHRAGPLVDGVQRCTRCGYILSDYRNAAWPEGQPPPTGFEVGKAIDVEPGNPRWSSVTDDAPTCVEAR